MCITSQKPAGIIGDVLFDFNKHNIKPVGRPVLDEIAEVVKNMLNIREKLIRSYSVNVRF